MGRRSLAALTCGALLAALATATGATSGASPSGTLTVVVPGDFTGCDPGSGSTSASTDAVLSLVLPSAFTAKPDGSPDSDPEVIALAEPIAPHPLTVVYSIAPGAAWPDGQPFTAGDLRRTWLQRRDGTALGDLGYRDVGSVTPSSNDRSATVVFTTPYADWQSLFDEMVPAATASARCALPSPALDPSLGPYELVTASAEELTLRANPRWTGAAPAFPRLVVTNRLDPIAFGAPRVVYLPAPTLTTLQSVTSSGSLDSRMFASSSVVSLDFALSGPEALSLDARRGVAALVDRAALVDELASPVDDTAAPEDSHLFGQGAEDYSGPFGAPVSHPATLPAPVPGGAGATAYGPGPQVGIGDADLVAAGYQLGALGWGRGGRPTSLCLAVPAHAPSLAAAAAVVAGQLESRGLAVAVEALPSSQAVAAALRGGRCASGLLERDGAWYVSQVAASWLAPPSPMPSGLLWEGLEDPVVARDAQLASTILNPVDAAPTWNLLDDRLWALMVGLPLYSPSAYVGWSTSVAGVQECNSLVAFVDQIPTTLVPAAPLGAGGVGG